MKKNRKKVNNNCKKTEKRRFAKRLKLSLFLSFLVLVSTVLILLFLSPGQDSEFKPTPPVNLADVSIDDLQFELNHNDFTATLIYPKVPSSTLSGVLRIPETYNNGTYNYTVVRINTPGEFEGSQITEVIVPKSVVVIEAQSFGGMAVLEKITIPFIGHNNGVNTGDAEVFPYIFGAAGSSPGTDFYNVFPGVLSTFRLPKSLKHVIVTNDFELSSYAFAQCEYLETITINDNPSYTIGNSVFANCSKLQKVVLPSRLASTSMGNWVFQHCISLTEVYTNEVASLPENQRYNTIPSGITVINEGTFNNCVSLKSFTFPDSIITIGNGAFYMCKSLLEINLPYKLQYIGKSTFQSCVSAKFVSIPVSIKEIGEGSLSGCTSLTALSLPFVGRIKGTDTSNPDANLFGWIFGTDVAANCWATSQITSLDDTTPYISYIPESLKTITIYSETVIEYGAFSNMTGIETIILPDTVERIEFAAFANCRSLKELSLPFVGRSRDETDIRYTTFGSIFDENAGFGLVSQVYFDALGTERKWFIPQSLKTVSITDHPNISSKSFLNCKYLENIIIGKATLTIGEGAFSGCERISSMTLPFVGNKRNSLTTYNSTNFRTTTFGYIFGSNWYALPYVFEPLTGLEPYMVKPKYNSSLPVTYFVPINLTKVTITDDTSVSSYSFSGVTSIKELIFEAEVDKIGSGALADLYNLEKLTLPHLGYFVDEFEKVTSLYSETTLSHYFGTTQIPNSYVANSKYIPNSLKSVEVLTGTTIPDNAFKNFKSLENIILPKFVKSIGASAFYECTNLKHISLEGATLTEIKDYTFYNCNFSEIDLVNTLSLPKSIKKIGNYAFYGNLLTDIDLSQYTSIGNYAFANNVLLTTIDIPSTLETIGIGAFSGCTSLRNVSVVAPTISESMFEGCTALASIDLSSSVTIGKNAFQNCSKLTTVVFGPSLSTIGERAFANCILLKSFELPNNLKTIATRAFENCKSLTSVTLPRGVTSLAANIFVGCQDNVFVIYTYLREEERPKTWVNGWNANPPSKPDWPVIVIGEEFEELLIYEYSDVYNGWIVVGVKEGVELSGLIEIPNRHYSAPVVGIADGVFSTFYAITDVIINSNMKYIGKDAFGDRYSNNTIKNIYLVSATSQNYAIFTDPIKVEEWLVDGRVYADTLWDYVDGYPTPNATALEYVFENPTYTYNEKEHCPKLLYVQSLEIVVGTAENLRLYDYNITNIDDSNYKINYYNNIHAGTATAIVNLDGLAVYEYYYTINRSLIIMIVNEQSNYVYMNTSYAHVTLKDSNYVWNQEAMFTGGLTGYTVKGRLTRGTAWNLPGVYTANQVVNPKTWYYWTNNYTYISTSTRSWGGRESNRTFVLEVQVFDKNGNNHTTDFYVQLSLTVTIPVIETDDYAPEWQLNGKNGVTSQPEFVGYAYDDFGEKIHLFQYSGETIKPNFYRIYLQYGLLTWVSASSIVSYGGSITYYREEIDGNGELKLGYFPIDYVNVTGDTYRIEVTLGDLGTYAYFDGTYIFRFRIVPREVYVDVNETVLATEIGNYWSYDYIDSSRLIGDGYTGNNLIKNYLLSGTLVTDSYLPGTYNELNNNIAFLSNLSIESHLGKKEDLANYNIHVRGQVVIKPDYIDMDLRIGSKDFILSDHIPPDYNNTQDPKQEFYEIIVYYTGFDQNVRLYSSLPGVLIEYAWATQEGVYDPNNLSTTILSVNEERTYHIHFEVSATDRYQKRYGTLSIKVVLHSVDIEENFDKVYDAQPHNIYDFINDYDYSGAVTILYFDEDKNSLSEPPTDSGKYYLTYFFGKTALYYDLYKEYVPFEITKRQISIDITGSHHYDEETGIYQLTVPTNTEFRSAGMLLNQQYFNGLLYLWDSLPAVYNSSDSRFVWKNGTLDYWTITDLGGLIDYSSNYEFTLTGAYTIKWRKIEYTITGIDEVYTGLNYEIDVTVTKPVTTSYAIVYSDGTRDDSGNLIFDIYPPSFRLPIDTTIWVKITAEGFEDELVEVPVVIRPLTFDYVIQDINQLFDYNYHEISVTVSNCISQYKIEYGILVGGVIVYGYIPEPYRLPIDTTIWVRITADGYTTVIEEITVKIIPLIIEYTINGETDFEGILEQYTYDAMEYFLDIQVQKPSLGVTITYDIIRNDETGPVTLHTNKYYTDKNSLPIKFIMPCDYTVRIKIVAEGYATVLEDISVVILPMNIEYTINGETNFAGISEQFKNDGTQYYLDVQVQNPPTGAEITYEIIENGPFGSETLYTNMSYIPVQFMYPCNYTVNIKIVAPGCVTVNESVTVYIKGLKIEYTINDIIDNPGITKVYDGNSAPIIVDVTVPDSDYTIKYVTKSLLGNDIFSTIPPVFIEPCDETIKIVIESFMYETVVHEFRVVIKEKPISYTINGSTDFKGIDTIFDGIAYPIFVDVLDPPSGYTITYFIKEDGEITEYQEYPYQNEKILLDIIVTVVIEATGYKKVEKTFPVIVKLASKDNLKPEFETPGGTIADGNPKHIIIPYDGNPHTIEVILSSPSTAYILYNTRDVEHTGLGWYTYPPTFTELGVYSIFYQVQVADMFIYKEELILEIVKRDFQDTYPDEVDYLEIVGFNDHYDKLDHSVTITPMNMLIGNTITVYYYVNSNWTLNKPSYTYPGDYTITFKVTAPYYEDFTSSVPIIIKDSLEELDAEITGYTGIYDGLFHGVTIDIKSPVSTYSVYYYSPSADVGGSLYVYSGTTYGSEEIKFKYGGQYVVTVLIIAEGYMAFKKTVIISIERRTDEVFVNPVLEYTELQEDINNLYTSLWGHNGQLEIRFYTVDEYGVKSVVPLTDVPMNVGNYFAEISFHQSESFHPAYCEGPFEIIPKTIDIEDRYEYEYSGEEIVSRDLVFEMANGDVVTVVLTVTGTPVKIGNELHYPASAAIKEKNSNYVLSQENTTIVVIPREVTILISDEKEYDGAIYTRSEEEFIVDNLLDGHYITFTAYTSNSHKAEYVYRESGGGNYTVIVEAFVFDKDGYDVSQYYKITIDYRVVIHYPYVKVEAPDLKFEYDGNMHTPVITILSEPLTVGAEFIISLKDKYSDYIPNAPMPSFGDVIGTFTVEYRIHSTDGLYEATFGTIVIEVLPYKLEVELNNSEVPYSANYYIPDLVITDKFGFSHTPTISYYYSKSDRLQELPKNPSMSTLSDMVLVDLGKIIDAGYYYMLVEIPTGEFSEGYQYAFVIRIIHGEIILEFSDLKLSKPYDGDSYKLSSASGYIIKGPVGNDYLFNALFDIYTNGSDQGIYGKGNFITGSNFKVLNDAGVEVTHNYIFRTQGLQVTITKAYPNGLSLSDEDLVYTGSALYPALLANGNPAVNGYGKVNYTIYSYDPIYDSVGPATDPINVGWYYAIATVEEGENYLAYDGYLEGYFRIIPKNLKLTWVYVDSTGTERIMVDGQKFIYSGISQTVKAYYTENGVKKYIEVEYFNSTDGKKMGLNYVRPKDQTGNYIYEPESISFEITKRSVIINISDTKLYDGDVWAKVYENDDLKGINILPEHIFRFIVSTKIGEPGRYDDNTSFNYEIRFYDEDGNDITDEIIIYYDFTYYLLVNIELPRFVFNSSNKEVGYTGEYYTIDVDVISPANYEIFYSTSLDGSFTKDIPMFKEVGSYTIYFQLFASGYQTAFGNATLTITISPSKILINDTTISKIYDNVEITVQDIYDAILPSSRYDGNLTIEILNLNEMPTTALNVGQYYIHAYTTGHLSYTELDEYILFEIYPRVISYSYEEVMIWENASDVGNNWEYTIELSVSSIPGLLPGHLFYLDIATPTSSQFPSIADMRRIYEDMNTDFQYICLVYDASSNDYTQNYEIHLSIKVQIRYKYMTVTVDAYEGDFDESFHGLTIDVIEPSDFDISIPDKGKIYYSASDNDNTYTESPLEYFYPGAYRIYYIITYPYYEDVKNYAIVYINYNVHKLSDQTIDAFEDLNKVYDAEEIVPPEIVFDDYYIEPFTPEFTYFTRDGAKLTAMAPGEIPKNVGDYRIVLKVPAGYYYANFVYEYDFTISKRSLVLSGDVHKDYDTYVFEYANWVTNPLPGQTVSGNEIPNTSFFFRLKTSGSATGIYEGLGTGIVFVDSNTFVVMEGSENVTANYQLDISNLRIIIDEVEMLYTVNVYNGAWDGSAHGISFTLRSPTNPTSLMWSLEGDIWHDISSLSTVKYTNVGEYPVYIRATSPNYIMLNEVFYIRIGYVNVEVTASFGKVYDALPLNPSISTNTNATPKITYYSMDDLTKQLDYAPIDVGKYRAELIYFASGPYKEYYQVFDFEITPYILDISWGPTSYLYDGLSKKPSAHFTPLRIDTIIPDYEIELITGGDLSVTKAGRYKVTIDLKNNNYKLSADDTFIFEIVARSLIVSGSFSKQYDGNYWIHEYPNEIGLTCKNLLAGHSVQILGLSTISPNIKVYSGRDDFNLISLIVVDSSGNDVTDGYSLNLTNLEVIIQESVIEATVVDYYGEYDGASHSITVIPKYIYITPTIVYSWKNAAGTPLTSSTKPSFIDPGIYEITVTFSHPSYVDLVLVGTVEIYKSTPAINIPPIADKVYNGNPITNPSFTLGRTYTSDQISYRYYEVSNYNGLNDLSTSLSLSGPPTYVGNYVVVIIAAETNYHKEVMAEQYFNIVRANLTIIISDVKEYDGSPWSHEVEASSLSGLASTDEFSGTLYTKGADIGTYTDGNIEFEWSPAFEIKHKVGDGTILNDQYNINYTLNVVIVEGKLDRGDPDDPDDDYDYLIIEVDVEYDGNFYTIDVQVSSKFGPDVTIKYMDSSGNYTLTVPPTFNQPGDHIVYVEIAIPNYETVYDSGNVKIRLSSDIEVTIDDLGKIYDTLPIGDPGYSTLSDGDPIYAYYNAADFDFTKDFSNLSDLAGIPRLPGPPTNVGDYVVVVAIGKGTYYDEHANYKEFSITPAEIEIVWDDTPLYYNGSVQYPTAEITYLGTDVGVLTYELADTTDPDYGVIANKDFTVIASTPNSNYVITNPEYEYKILRQQVEIPLVLDDEKEIMYDTLSHSLTLAPNVLYTIESVSAIDVATYYVDLTLLDPDNYVWIDAAGNEIEEIATLEFDIIPRNDKVSIDDIPPQEATGSQLTPSIVVRYKDDDVSVEYELVLDQDYEIVEYGPNIDVKGTVEIKGIGNFDFTLIAEFDIIVTLIKIKDSNTVYEIWSIELDPDAWFLESYLYEIVDERQAYDPDEIVVINKIREFTTIEQFLSQIDTPLDFIKVYDNYDNLIDSADYSAFIATGFSIVLEDSNGNVSDKLVVIVPGDIDSSGYCDYDDIFQVLDSANYAAEMELYSLIAADVYFNGLVSFDEFMAILSHADYAIDLFEDLYIDFDSL